jgi:hypothetical protein
MAPSLDHCRFFRHGAPAAPPEEAANPSIHSRISDLLDPKPH